MTADVATSLPAADTARSSLSSRAAGGGETPLPEIGTVWRQANRPIRTYKVLEHLDAVVLADGHELPREVLCERSDHTGKRQVKKRGRDFHPFDGHLTPIGPIADEPDLEETERG